MARSGSESLFKKNTKLESYLKRNLSDEAFERVRAYESCIVVSEKENKAFKYVILGDESIYLTENPPKNLQESVYLKDIVAVELVNDFPEFLSGEERENTQHLSVTFWTTESVKRRSFKKGRKSPRLGSVSDLHGDRSNASTPLGYMSQESTNWSDDYGYATQSLSSLQVSRPDSRGSIGSNGKPTSIKKKKNRLVLGDSSDETLLKSLKEEMEEDGLEDIEENDGLSNSFSSSLQRTSSNKKRELPDPANSKSAFTNKDSDQSSQKGVSGETISLSGSVRSNRPLPPMVPKTAAFETLASPPSQTIVSNSSVEKSTINVGVDHSDDTRVIGTVEADDETPTCCCSKLFCFKNGKNQIFPFCSKKDATLEDSVKNANMLDSKESSYPEKIPLPDITLDSSSHEISALGSKGQRGSVPSLHEATRSRRSSITSNLRPPSRSGTPALESEPTFTRSVRIFHRDSAFLGNLANASYSDLGGSVNGLSAVGVEIPEKRKTILNIYLLNLHSPMLMLIRSAWSNYLIRLTMMLDPEYEKVFKSSVVRGSHNQREKMEMLFSQLKRELLNQENTMEDTFNLLNELRVATERNFALKKMFWKNADMFLFLVRQLQRYLPKSPINIHTDHGKLQRVDEFELVILLTEMLSLMFRESEIIPARIQTLRAERGKYVLDLLMVLTCSPEIPNKFSVPTRSTMSVGGSFKGGDGMSMDVDAEIEKQLVQFTKTGLAAVYELFLMAKQANWGYSEGNFFNIGWMVKVLEEIRTTEKFVDRVIQQMLKLLGPGRREVLNPVEGVLLYTQFSVIQTFLQYSPRLAAFIRSNYMEEFKYFVQIPAVSKKLPGAYPISVIIMPLIEAVMSKVLEKPTVAFPKSPRE
ncbi:uncharacterized protein C12orf56-like isoform X2 [Mizuhopecten yessoensis]|uniref:Uncharacterized protein n=1 Tax=Mizuhopecten yessoensis TaxID=6573 RepID=A0A210PMS1_MIZYE|nr:uncharacterized protein C12orf56-like isoform X2 [Mizuhopecten yessoensis]OWF37764.1 hypothetical protein KP79_PYT12093 [Mizuhopecten yessoensis]